ncbi:uncharacterized protein LOC143040323 isoform X2 [Oratosquilla oratoria]
MQNSSIYQDWVSEESENEGSVHFGSNHKVDHIMAQNENDTRASKWDTYLESSLKEEQEGESDDDEYVYTTVTGAKRRRGRANQVKIKKNHKATHGDEAGNFRSSYSQLTSCQDMYHFKAGSSHTWQSDKTSLLCTDMTTSKNHINDEYSLKEHAEDGYSTVMHANEHIFNPVVSNTMGTLQGHCIDYEKTHSSPMSTSSSQTRPIHRPRIFNSVKPENSKSDEIQTTEKKQNLKENKSVVKSSGVVQASRWNRYVDKEESESEEEEENENTMYVNRDRKVGGSMEEALENEYLLESVATEEKRFGKVPSLCSNKRVGHEAYGQSYSNFTDRSLSKSESFSLCLTSNQERERPKRNVEQSTSMMKPDKPPVSRIKQTFLAKRHSVESKYLDLEDDLQLGI